MRHILLLVLIAVCCWNCQEDKLAIYDGQDGIYFVNYYAPNTNAENVYTDTTSFSFALVSVSDSVMHIGVQGLGNTMGIDRPFRVKVVNTNAVAGVHYDELQSEYILKANNVNSSVPIHLYRESIPADTTFYIELELVANDYFVPNVEFKEVKQTGGVTDTIYITRHVLTFSNSLYEPTPWISLKSYVGEWTETKFHFINETLSIDPALWYGESSKWSDLMWKVMAGAVFMKNYLNSLIVQDDYINYPKDPDNSDATAKGYMTVPSVTIPEDWPNASEVE